MCVCVCAHVCGHMQYVIVFYTIYKGRLPIRLVGLHKFLSFGATALCASVCELPLSISCTMLP